MRFFIIAITLIRYFLELFGEEVPTAVVYDKEDGDLTDQMRETGKQRPIVDVWARDQRMESCCNGSVSKI